MTDREDEYQAYLEQVANEPVMDWEEGDPLPPWKPNRDRRYRQKITDWTNWQLDRAPFEEIKPNYMPLPFEWLSNGGPEIVAAEKGDIAPLRRKFPQLAAFLHLPKRGHGKRLPIKQWCDHDPARFAALEVEEIKALWQRHYGKRVRRFKPTAVEIAAGRWGVAPADVEQWIRHLAVKK